MQQKIRKKEKATLSIVDVMSNCYSVSVGVYDISFIEPEGKITAILTLETHNTCILSEQQQTVLHIVL